MLKLIMIEVKQGFVRSKSGSKILGGVQEGGYLYYSGRKDGV